MAYKIQSILFLFIIWLFAESQKTLLDKSMERSIGIYQHVFAIVKGVVSAAIFVP